jgi:MATE family multidrug resistance protein
VAGAGALRGLKDTTVPMFITAFSYWGLGVPIGYYLGIVCNLGPRGVWMGPIGGLLFAAILLNIRFYRVMARRIRQVEMERSSRGAEWTEVDPPHEVGELTSRS